MEPLYVTLEDRLMGKMQRPMTSEEETDLKIYYRGIERTRRRAMRAWRWHAFKRTVYVTILWFLRAT